MGEALADVVGAGQQAIADRIELAMMEGRALAGRLALVFLGGLALLGGLLAVDLALLARGYSGAATASSPFLLLYAAAGHGAIGAALLFAGLRKPPGARSP